MKKDPNRHLLAAVKELAWFDKVTAKVLAYHPKPKTKAAKKRLRKKKRESSI